MTGTGEVTKRRIREGIGEFPIDCPLEDNAVRVHYKAFRLSDNQVGLPTQANLYACLLSQSKASTPCILHCTAVTRRSV